jgi:outer membrane receptor protein involved in Fe transport
MNSSVPTGPILHRVAPVSLAAVALFLAAGFALGLQGRVVMEATGAPIAGAEVSVLGLTGAQRTDTDGRFLWLPDPVAPFEVLIVLPGGQYMKPFLVTSIPAGGLVTITVRPIVEESVTVTAGAAPSIESPPANGTTIVPKADIESRQPSNLAETVENVAGLSRIAAAQNAVPAIRGLAHGRSVILLDGARVSSEQRAGPGARYLDPFVLSGVEVSRGPGSVAYGSDAFGGVISARSRDVAPGAPLSVEAIGDYALGIPGGRVGVAATSPIGQDGGILVAGHYRSYGNYDSPDGEVPNSGYRDSGVLASAAYNVGPGTLKASWEGDYARDIGLPAPPAQTFRMSLPEENSSRFNLAYETQPVGGFSRIAFLGFIGSNDVSTALVAPASTEQVDVSAKDFQIRGFAERFVGPVRVDVGLDLNGRYGLHAVDDTNGTVKTSVVDAHRTDLGVYLTAEVPLLPRLALQGGVRGDFMKTANEGGDVGDHTTSNNEVAGNVALTAGSFGGFSATAQYAHGFRDPLLSDRYFSGLFGRGFITGNPNLELETSNQYDVALRYTNAGFRTAFYMYDYRIKNLIEVYSDRPRQFRLRNHLAGAKLQGLELEAQVALPAGFAVALAGQIERGVTVDDDRPIDDIPPKSLNLQVRKSFGPAFAQARWVVYAGDDKPGLTEVSRPGYGLLDLGGGYSFSEHFEFQAYVRNVLNRTYFNTPLDTSALAPGVSATLTGFVRF